MNYNSRELLLIWLDSFIQLDYKQKYAIYSSVTEDLSVKKFLEDKKSEIIKSVGEQTFDAIYRSANKEYLQTVLSELFKADEKAITVESEYYPERLKEIADPPLVLYAKGNTELLKDEIFGIVGSRKSLPFSEALATEFAEDLISAGFTLITGTAGGIDEKVLTAGIKSGKIISVSAGGLNCVYPAFHKELLNDVAKHGLLISERRENIAAQPYFFPIRNRIIAGLSVGVLAVNGRLKSGVISTAEYCVDYGRDLFAVPYSPKTESGEGTNYLIKNGAMLCDSPKDILSYYGKESDEIAENDLSDSEREIISSLKDGALHIEKIAETIGKAVFELTPTLTVLEIKGIIYKDGTNTYGLVRG